MKLKDYEKYKAAVEHNWRGVEAVSTGSCSGCEECGLEKDCDDHARELAEEPSFSWSACDSCGSTLGGNRHPAHGLINGELEHFSVCDDCLYYLNYGQLDDLTMMGMEKD